MVRNLKRTSLLTFFLLLCIAALHAQTVKPKLTVDRVYADNYLATDNCIRVGDADADTDGTCTCRDVSTDRLYGDKDCDGTKDSNEKFLDGETKYFDVQDYGAVGDGVTDDTAAINSAIAASAGSGTLYFPPGTYLTSSTIQIYSDVLAFPSATILFDADDDVAVYIRHSSEGTELLRKMDIHLPNVVKNSKQWGDGGSGGLLNDVGVEVWHIYESQIYIPHIQNFSRGLNLRSDGAGHVYNTYHIGQLDNNKINLAMENDKSGATSGWINQNTFIGGRYSHNTAEGTDVTGVYQVWMELGSGATGAPNNNVFLNPSLEGDAPIQHVYVRGDDNSFVGARWEATAPKVELGPGATENAFYGGTQVEDIVFTEGASTDRDFNIANDLSVYGDVNAEDDAVVRVHQDTAVDLSNITIEWDGSDRPVVNLGGSGASRENDFALVDGSGDRIMVDGDGNLDAYGQEIKVGDNVTDQDLLIGFDTPGANEVLRWSTPSDDFRLTDDLEISGDMRSSLNPWIDVTHADYGASYDCATDAGTAIQDALNIADTGQTVFLPPTDGSECYTIDGGTTLTIPNGVTLYGPGARIEHSGVPSVPLFTLSNKADILIEGLELDQNNSTANQRGLIEIQNNSSRITIKDLDAEDGYSAVWVKGGSDIKILNSRITDFSHPVYLGENTNPPSTNVSRVTITGNTIWGAKSGGDGIKSVSLTRKLIISDNHIWGNDQDGIDLFTGGEEVTITGNVLEGNTVNGVDIKQDEENYPEATWGSNRVVAITGNQILNNTNRGVSISSQGGTHLDYASHYTVTGNVIKDNGYHGIFSAGSHTSIVGNLLVENGTSSDGAFPGIYVLGLNNVVKNVSVVGNVITNNGRSDKTNVGINVNQCQNCTVTGNTITDDPELDGAGNTDWGIAVYRGSLDTRTHTGADNATVLTLDEINADCISAGNPHSCCDGASSGCDLTADEYIGYTIYNTTDGSRGTITDNDATTITVNDLLRGEDNTFQASDSVLVGGGNVVVSSNTIDPTLDNIVVDNEDIATIIGNPGVDNVLQSTNVFIQSGNLFLGDGNGNSGVVALKDDDAGANSNQLSIRASQGQTTNYTWRFPAESGMTVKDCYKAASVPGSSLVGVWEECVKGWVDVTAYGATGNCSTDDAAAIQSAADAVPDGGTLYFPPTDFSAGDCYSISKTIFLDDRNDVTISGYGATIQADQTTPGTTDDFRACIAVVGPAIGVDPPTDAEWESSILNTANYGNETSRNRIEGITCQMGDNTSSGNNLGLVLNWQSESSIVDSYVTSSNGNGMDIRQCLDCVVDGNKVENFRNFGIFPFQTIRAKITDNIIDGDGTGGATTQRGIDLKQTYVASADADVVNGAIIEGNTITDINDLYWITSGNGCFGYCDGATTTLCDDDSDCVTSCDTFNDGIYLTGHERVSGVRIKNNNLRRIASTRAPTITLGVFTEEFQIEGNTLDGDDYEGQAIALGASGNPDVCGTATQGLHTIKKNHFDNWLADTTSVVGAGASVDIDGNVFNGSVKWLLSASTHVSNISSVEYVNFNNNYFNGTMVLHDVGSNGVYVASGADFEYFEAKGNVLNITSKTNAAKTSIVPFYPGADWNVVTDNTVTVTPGGSVTTHDNTYGINLQGGGGIVERNEINVDADSSGAAYGVFTSVDDWNVNDNLFVGGATATTTRAIHVSGSAGDPNVKMSNNKFAGTWDNKYFDGSSIGGTVGGLFMGAEEGVDLCLTALNTSTVANQERMCWDQSDTCFTFSDAICDLELASSGGGAALDCHTPACSADVCEFKELNAIAGVVTCDGPPSGEALCSGDMASTCTTDGNCTTPAGCASDPASCCGNVVVGKCDDNTNYACATNAECLVQPGGTCVDFAGSLVMRTPDGSDDYYMSKRTLGTSGSLLLKDEAYNSVLTVAAAADGSDEVSIVATEIAGGSRDTFRIENDCGPLEIVSRCGTAGCGLACSAGTDSNINMTSVDGNINISAPNGLISFLQAETSAAQSVTIGDELVTSASCAGTCSILFEQTETTAGDQIYRQYNAPGNVKLIEKHVDSTNSFQVYAFGSAAADFSVVTTSFGGGSDGYQLLKAENKTVTVGQSSGDAATLVTYGNGNFIASGGVTAAVYDADTNTGSSKVVQILTPPITGGGIFIDEAPNVLKASLTGDDTNGCLTLSHDVAGNEKFCMNDDGFIGIPGIPNDRPVLTGTADGDIGHVMWGSADDTASDTGTEVCANNGLSCETTYIYNVSGAASDKSFGFQSPSGSSGTFYVAGAYAHDSGSNDFNPSVIWGTANISYAAHVYFVCGSDPATNPVIEVTGTRIQDDGTRTAAYTASVTIDGGVDAYYETSEKFNGQITIEKVSGDDTACNYGWASYFDWGNRDFTVTGLSWWWRGGANDADADIEMLHHKTTGWTYNALGEADPPTPITGMSSIHAPEDETRNASNHKFKNTNLSTLVTGSGSEGIIFRMTTTANKSIEQSDIILSIQSEGGKLACGDIHTDYFAALCY